ncbi:hypothetical protein [Brachyspira innocens]|uniref:SMODS domain-containing nucleotidyltransferase n=1 Tax=Brachyspira innocens TaxID=13264 RepID=UPI0026ED55D4|nr:hypothetical protein [Brachyspira innocens]
MNTYFTNFDEKLIMFIKDKLDLKKSDIEQANNSLKVLQNNIINIFNKTPFLDIYFEKCINYGSYARGTKIFPLDDIDFTICIKANYRTYSENNKIIIISPNDKDKMYSDLVDNNYLNSNKVLNHIKKNINSNYSRSDICKDGEAVRLSLNSYKLNFDIVPSFYTKPEKDGRQYYLIPDGYGNWKKTDPIIDKKNIINLRNKNINTINVIKLIKYWNKTKKVKTVSSYLLECMMIEYFNNIIYDNTSIFVMFKDALLHISKNIEYGIVDPKGIQGDLIKAEGLKEEQKESISTKAKKDYNKCKEVEKMLMNCNYSYDYDEAINKFSEVLNGFND